MVSLCCGLNLLFNVVKSPSLCYIFLVSSVLMILGIVGLFCLASFFMSAICSACAMLCNLKILFTSGLTFLSSLYLSSASLFNVGCLIMGLPSLGPAFCFLSALATGMACIAALVASATAFAIASLVFICSLATICICTLSAYVCLYETFYFWHHVVFLVFMKITPLNAFMSSYCYCVNLEWVCVYMCAWLYMQW